MNPRRLLTRGIVFSYGALVAQTFYSFASIPLALSHLSTAEFGMWGVILTVGTYIMMAEAGMTESFIRHLIECKDGRDSGLYGRLYTAAVLAQGCVAVIVLAAGIAAAFFTATLLKIPLELQRDFTLVMSIQAAISAVMMATRMSGIPLVLHHRQDLSQLGQIGLFVISYLVLYFAFRSGWGIYSLPASQAAGLLWIVPFQVTMCHRLGFLPSRGTIALPTRPEWNEVWSYSLNQFMVQIGGTILVGLPQLLISSFAGLHAAGLWTICTRVFGVLRQFASRPHGIMVPLLLDYFVRGDVPLAVRRWVHASQIMIAMSGLMFAVAAANNRRFVELWTGVGSDWGTEAHVWIAFYFLCAVAASAAYSVIGFNKQFGIARVIPIFQVIVVASFSWLAAKIGGSTGIIAVAAFGYLLGMFIFGMRLLGKVTGQNSFSLARAAALRPMLAAAPILLQALFFARACESIPGYLGLFLSVLAGTVVGLPFAGFLGVSPNVREELSQMMPLPLRSLISPRSRPASADEAS